MIQLVRIRTRRKTRSVKRYTNKKTTEFQQQDSDHAFLESPVKPSLISNHPTSTKSVPNYKNSLVEQGYAEKDVVVERYVNLRYQGTDNSVMIQEPTTTDLTSSSSNLPYADAFREHYKREFGFDLQGRDLLIDDYRVRAIVPGKSPGVCMPVPALPPPTADSHTEAYFETGWEKNVPVFRAESLKPVRVCD